MFSFYRRTDRCNKGTTRFGIITVDGFRDLLEFQVNKNPYQTVTVDSQKQQTAIGMQFYETYYDERAASNTTKTEKKKTG